MPGPAQYGNGLFGDPVLQRLLASDALAFFGVWMTSLVVLTGVYETTHSSLAQGIAIASQFGPALLVMPLAGHLLDRCNPVLVLFVSRGLCGAIAIVLFLAGPAMPVALVLALNVVFGTVFGLSVTAMGVLLPLAIAGNDLVRANIVFRLVPNAMMIVGGLLLVMGGGASGIYGELVLAGAAFFLSLILLAPETVRQPFKRADLPVRGDISQSFLDGLRYLVRERSLLLRFLVRMGVFVCSGGVIVMAILAETEFQHVVNAVGLFFAARGLGMIIGSVGALPFLNSGRGPEEVALVAGLCLFGIAIAAAAFGVQFGLITAAALFAVAYAGEGIAKPVSLSLLQRRIAPAYLGRVMALEQGLSAAVQTGLTMLVATILIAPSREAVMVVAAGLGVLTLAVALAAVFAGRTTAAPAAAVPQSS